MLNLLDMRMTGALFLRDVCWLALSASLKSCRRSFETSARSLWQSPGGVGLCSHFCSSGHLCSSILHKVNVQFNQSNIIHAYEMIHICFRILHLYHQYIDVL